MNSATAEHAAVGEHTDLAFMPVPLTTLGVSTSLSVDLYLKSKEDAPPLLYREREYPMSQEEIERLVQSGIRVAYIPVQQVANYQLHLRDNLEAFLLDEEIPPTRRYEFLSETARDLLNKSFEHGNTEVLMQTTSELGDRMVEMVVNHNLVTADLFKILRHDYKTFTHSFNTSSFCLLAAKRLGIADADQLKEIATGALLHDVGKLNIPNSILTKKSRLTEVEWQVIRQHPVEGFMLLCQRDDLSQGQLMMVYQHHERIDGRGYPVGQPGEDIHDLARLCAVVDVFEAMTSHRPYRKAIPVPEVLDHLDAQAGTALDEEIVRCWKAVIRER